MEEMEYESIKEKNDAIKNKVAPSVMLTTNMGVQAIQKKLLALPYFICKIFIFKIIHFDTATIVEAVGTLIWFINEYPRNTQVQWVGAFIYFQVKGKPCLFV